MEDKKKMKCGFFLIILYLNLFGLSAWGQRSVSDFDRDWRFARFGLQADGSRLPEPDSLEAYEVDDTGWRKLDVPHDWAIEGPFRTGTQGNCLGRESVGTGNILKCRPKIRRRGFIWISMARWRMPRFG